VCIRYSLKTVDYVVFIAIVKKYLVYTTTKTYIRNKKKFYKFYKKVYKFYKKIL